MLSYRTSSTVFGITGGRGGDLTAAADFLYDGLPLDAGIIL